MVNNFFASRMLKSLMRDETIERAKKMTGLQQEVNEQQERLEQLQSEMFGNDSRETEEKAREFFSNVGGDRKNSGRTQEIDELRARLSESKSKLETVREELQKLLVEIRFPLNETITTENDKVEFPYDEDIPQEVIDAIEIALGEDLNGDPVSIDNDAIRVHATEVDEAMDMAVDRIESLRSKANNILDVEGYVEELHDRDQKIIKTLYALQQADRPLSKSEIEKRIGVDNGVLRGNLYYVLDNDPYLKKSDSQFSLTDVGKRVIEVYCRHHGVPDNSPGEVEA